ncbi:MAG: FxsA family protein [Pikeienuella sp.]
MWIILVLVAIPIIEIALFIELGGWVGLWPTIGLVIITAIIGGILLRAQGFSAMQRMQRSMAEGGDPRGPMAHGILILIAGLLMLTPGFFTDAVGFTLLVPPARTAIIAAIGPWVAKRVVTQGMAQSGGMGGMSAGAHTHTGNDDPIDVDYVDLTGTNDDAKGTHRSGRSGWSRHPNDPPAN